MHTPRVNQEIQALRAIAVMLVFIHHLHALFYWDGMRWLMRGKGLWVGVDLFFCISGYVIGSAIVSTLINAHGRAFWREALAFWLRRVYRIVPTAWTWVIVPFAIAPFIHFSGAVVLNHQNIFDALAIVFHFTNIRYYLCTVGQADCGLFALYWSLALEEQFYVLLPLAVFFFRKRLWQGLLLLVLAQVFLHRNVWMGLPSFIRTDALLFGVLLSMSGHVKNFKMWEPIFLRHWHGCGYVLAPVLVLLLVFITRYEIVPFFTGLAALVSGVIVWLCSYQQGYFLPDGWIRKVLAWVGERSFAIYLIHTLSFTLTRDIWPRLMGVDYGFHNSFLLPFLLTSITITLLLADLNYRFLETPLRRLGRHQSDRLLQP